MNPLSRNRSLAFAVFSLAAPLFAAAQAPAAPAALLGSTFYNPGTLTATPTKSGSRTDVYDGPTSMFNRLSIHITTLNPGLAVHPPQSHQQEEAVLVKEGSLQVSLNGKLLNAGPGALLFLAPHAVHNLTNVGDKPASYYVIDVYTDATATVPDQPYDELAPPGKLHSTVIDCDHLPSKPTKNGSRTDVADSPTATFVEFESHMTTLNPGRNNGYLTDPADEVIVVKSGLVESKINGVACRLGPGSFFFQAANDPHTMTNLGTTPTTYQIFKFVTDKQPKHSS